MNVAIQGIRACFHDVAARKFFKGRDINPIECHSFRSLCEALKKGDADVAMMAIENTIAGSILPNYSLLESYGFRILGETYLRIEMCLLALPGQSADAIRNVQSHPMAILQCQEYLGTLADIKIIEAADTAESAKEISERKLTAHAAIASELAGLTYGLEVLKKNIETDSNNFTRFLTLCRAQDYTEPHYPNKSTLRFEVDHQPGRLAQVLNILRDHGVNMTKIQSLPILGKPYQYGMHVDLEWADYAQFKKAMHEVGPYCANLIQFGVYHSGEKPSA